MTFQSHKASRSATKPLIGLFAESGAGKSMSALLLARGIVGASGNIQQIDTESGRGELYSDVIPGGYNSIQFSEPFTPARYIEAVRYAESLKADIIIIDQISSEWEAILSMAADNEDSCKKGLSVWKTPKMEHTKMMARLLQSPCPIIVCLRAKYKSRQVKGANGRTEIVKDDSPTPIQADDFIFEMTAHALILPDHTIRLTKHSHPSLKDCFPQDGKEPLGVKHGEAIAAWAKGATTSAPQAPKKQEPQTSHAGQVEDIKRRIWDRAKGHFDGDVKAFQCWLEKNLLLAAGESLSSIPSDRLESICDYVENELEVKW